MTHGNKRQRTIYLTLTRLPLSIVLEPDHWPILNCSMREVYPSNRSLRLNVTGYPFVDQFTNSIAWAGIH